MAAVEAIGLKAALRKVTAALKAASRRLLAAMLAAAVAVAVLASHADAAPEASLDLQQVESDLADFRSVNCAVVVLNLGTEIEIAANESDVPFFREQLKDVLALQALGILNVEFLERGSEVIRYRVRHEGLSEHPDFRVAGSNACVSMAQGSVHESIVAVEAVKGGSGKWDGAIVYSEATSELTPLFKRFLAERKLPDLSARRYRYLYRHYPLEKAWELQVRDVAPLSGAFATDYVGFFLELE